MSLRRQLPEDPRCRKGWSSSTRRRRRAPTSASSRRPPPASPPTSSTASRPCQFGGNPDCSQCGCIASAGLAAVGAHRLPGGIRVGAIFETSLKIGRALRSRREAVGLMAQAASFDITSTVDLQEVDNAVNQARKEVAQRYDFKGSRAAIDLTRPRTPSS